MKKIIFIICIFVSMQVLSQNISKLENLKLHKSYLPIEAQIKIIQQNIISCLGNNNEILKQIREGVYQFSNNIKEIDGSPYLQLVNSKDKKVITSFKLIKSRDKNGALNYSVNYKDVSRLSTEDLSRFSVPIVLSPINIIVNNNILWDKEILYHEEIPQNLRKILNKSFIRTYFENQHGDTASLFKLCQAGKVIPFGSDARIITVDRGFHSIIYFNTNISEDSKEPLNKWYGYGGTGNNKFF